MGRNNTKKRLRAAGAGLAAGFALLGTADALAATAAGVDGTLTYTGGPGLVSNVDFVQSGTTVTIARNTGGGDNDPIASTGTCTTSGNGNTVTCTAITSVVADAGDQNDTLDASGLSSTIPATLRGGEGDDSIVGGGANDNLSGGAGNDFISGGGGDDTINGDAGSDDADGGAGNDILNGGDGNDGLSGGRGNDTVNGDGGDDFVSGDSGADVVNGGDGDDNLNNFNFVSPGADADNGDVYSGGSGLDTIFVFAGAAPVSVTLDDQANDGAAGEGDNVRADVESVNVGSGADTLAGNDATNQLTGGGGNDTIDGGRGNDILQGQDGDDTINAVDGFADVVTCGAGNDVANVDTLDTVSNDCETVNRQDVGNANDDRPPTLVVTSPANNANLPTGTPTTIAANVADDRGIAQVLFLVNGRLVCADTVAPYACAYQPTGADIGRTAITVVAVDSSQQTTTVIRSVNIGLFRARSFTSRVTPSRDARAPYRFTTTGKINLPTTVTAAQGCKAGVVSVQVKAGSRTISTRRVNISKACTFRVTTVFRDRSRFRGVRALKFTARFLGNAVLERRTASIKTARVR